MRRRITHARAFWGFVSRGSRNAQGFRCRHLVPELVGTELMFRDTVARLDDRRIARMRSHRDNGDLLEKGEERWHW